MFKSDGTFMLVGWQDSGYSDGLAADNKGLLVAGVGDHVSKG